MRCGRVPALLGRAKLAALVFAFLVFAACPLLETPEEARGRSSDPGAEVLVVHSLAETVSSIVIEGSGSAGAVDDDVTHLGSIPNGVVEVSDHYLVTLSGENALVALERTSLAVAGRYDFGAGTNPMESAVFAATGTVPSLVATSELLTDSVTVSVVTGGTITAVAELETGVAPQAVLLLPDTAAETVRLVVSNTAFSVSRPADRPFGAGTLSTWRIRFTPDADSPAGWDATVVASEVIALEAAGYDATTQAGVNAVALIDLAPENEVIIVCSGVNYGGDGAGIDDGSIIVLDRTTLAVKERIAVGGSPGSAAVLRSAGGVHLYLAGPTGIRSVERASVWSAGAIDRYAAEGAAGAVPFVADVAVVRDHLWAADFARSRVIAFAVGADGELAEAVSVSVSQGPIALWVDDE